MSATFSVCVIREVTPPPDAVTGYPYRDVSLVYSPSLGYLHFPRHSHSVNLRTGDPTADFHRAIIGEDSDRAVFLGLHSKRTLVFLIPNASPEAPSLDTPLTLHGGSGGGRVRALMDEVRVGRYCHAPIDDSVRELFFVPKGEAPVTLRGGPGVGVGVGAGAVIVSPLPETFDVDGRVPTTLAVVNAPGGRGGYLEFPKVGYHGTSELFVGSILRDGFRATKRLGLYGNNAYYFGNFWKAIHYTFRDSQYATIPEDGALRTEDHPGGMLRVPSTCHGSAPGKMEEDLIRDSPAMIRFILFPRASVVYPEKGDAPSRREATTGASGKGYRGDFVVYENKVGVKGKKSGVEGGSGGEVEGDITPEQVEAMVETATQEPLFVGDETVSSLGIDPDAPVLPVPPPTSMRERQAGVFQSFRRIHIAIQPASPSLPPKGVIVIRPPGAFPDLGVFFLMTSGFLTNTPGGIAGASITHITEEEVREMTTEGWRITQGGGGKVREVLPGALTSGVSHGLLLEDLVRCAPADAHLLVEVATLPSGSIERLRELMRQAGREDVQVILGERAGGGGGSRGAGGYRRILGQNISTPHQYTEDEYRDMEDLQREVARALGVTTTMSYDTPVKKMFAPGTVTLREEGEGKGEGEGKEGRKERSCSLRMEAGVFVDEYRRRIMYDKGVYEKQYLREYSHGGALRVISFVKDGKGKTFDENKQALMTLLEDRGWMPGEGEGEEAGAGVGADTLVIEPFSFEFSSKRRETSTTAMTNHTEIVIREEPGAPPRFLPASWHRGDQRSIYRHHHPMDMGGRIL